MRILTAGTGALLVCLDGTAEVTELCHNLLSGPPEGFIEAVPAESTVMVVFDPARIAAPQLSLILRAATARSSTSTSTHTDTNVGTPTARREPVINIPVVYDGPDLAETAHRTGLSVEEVIRRHEAGEYVVAFCGFAPGFAYLTGLDQTLRLPRRPVPRTRVPAGSVAVSDRYTSVYPNASPGGWHLLGRTDLILWDLERQPPALLAPGTLVRFQRVAPP